MLRQGCYPERAISRAFFLERGGTGASRVERVAPVLSQSSYITPCTRCSTSCCTSSSLLVITYTSMDSIVESLQQYTSCDVADALLKLKHPHGGNLADIMMYSPGWLDGDTKIVGPAYTVKFVRNNHVNDPKPAGHYIDGVPKGAVVFITGPKMPNAFYGGLLSTRAQYLGAVGTIVDGKVRDLNEHRSLGYPVFCKGVGTTPSGEVARPSETNVPVRLASEDQEAWVYPGDYIIADIDGVVCLPKDLAEKALELIPGIVEADQKVAADLRNGRVLHEAFAAHRGKK